MTDEQTFNERVEAYMKAYEMPRLVAEAFATFDLTDETCYVPDIECEPDES